MEELQKLKLLILQAPQQQNLLKGEIDGAGFEEYSQLPENADRESWWKHIRTVNGFLLYCIRDMLVRQADYFEKTNKEIAMLEDQLEALKRKKPVVKEPVVEKFEVEEVEPPNWVPGSTWDPFDSKER